MAKNMGFWPILTVFWPGRQKFKSRILRVIENELGAIKKRIFLNISEEPSYQFSAKSDKVLKSTGWDYTKFRNFQVGPTT